MHHDTLWDKTRVELIERLDRDTYERYLAGVVPVSFDMPSGHFILGTQNDLLTMWLDSNYASLISEIASDIIVRPVSIEFKKHVVERREEDNPIIEPVAALPTKRATRPPRQHSRANAAAQKTQAAMHVRNSSASVSGDRPFRPDYNFNSFVVGDSARTAFAAASAVAENPGHVYNPLFLYGKVGLGKTHLLQAIGNRFCEDRKNARVGYLTSEEFVNRYVEALQAGTLMDFRKRIRNLDLLLIDDVQFFEGKVSSSEEFFHTFNALHNAHKQIVLAADRTPAELKGLDDRMVSRFAGGLHEEVRAPGFETRVAILRKKQEKHRHKLDDEVIFLIANRVRSNIRNLESALTKLVMNVSAFGGDMSATRAEQLLADRFDAEIAQQVTVSTIQKQVAAYFDITLTDMLSSKRPRNIAEPRMVAMYLSRRMTDQSLPAIGKAFERNHATVMHAVDKIEKKMKSDDYFRSSVSQLERQLCS